MVGIQVGWTFSFWAWNIYFNIYVGLYVISRKSCTETFEKKPVRLDVVQFILAIEFAVSGDFLSNSVV